MTTKSKGMSKDGAARAGKKQGGRRHRGPDPTKGWFSMEQRARFKGQKEQA